MADRRRPHRAEPTPSWAGAGASPAPRRSTFYLDLHAPPGAVRRGEPHRRPLRRRLDAGGCDGHPRRRRPRRRRRPAQRRGPRVHAARRTRRPAGARSAPASPTPATGRRRHARLRPRPAPGRAGRRGGRSSPAPPTAGAAPLVVVGQPAEETLDGAAGHARGRALRAVRQPGRRPRPARRPAAGGHGRARHRRTAAAGGQRHAGRRPATAGAATPPPRTWRSTRSRPPRPS